MDLFQKLDRCLADMVRAKADWAAVPLTRDEVDELHAALELARYVRKVATRGHDLQKTPTE